MPTITQYTGLPSAATPAPALPVKQPDTLKTQASVSPVETKPEASGSTEDTNSSRLTQLARKEKQIHEARKQIQAERAKLESLQEELKGVQGWKANLAQDPLKVLNEAGLTYEQLTNLVLNGAPSQTPEALELQKVRQEVEAVKAAQEASAKDHATRVNQQVEETKKQLKNEVVQLVASDPSFFRIKDMGYEDAPVELIVEQFYKDGTLLPIEEATKLVNEYVKEEQLKFLRLPSTQALLKDLQAAETPPINTQPQTSVTKKPVIPNQTLSSSMQSTSKPSRHQSWSQKKADIIAKVMGQQKP